MKAKNTKDVQLQDKNILYVGTTEQIAKLAPIRGLEPPIFLTDVYPGFFCKQICQDERWGIISVNITQLHEEMFAPSPSYIDKFKKYKDPNAAQEKINKILSKIANYKGKWGQSLQSCGVCVYTSHIPPAAIQKVMIYNPAGRDSNVAINQLLEELPKPTAISPAQHKATYSKSLGVLRWFNGEPVKCEDIFNGQTNIKLINEIEDKLNNRFGLDLYYLKPEDKAGRGRKSVY